MGPPGTKRVYLAIFTIYDLALGNKWLSKHAFSEVLVAGELLLVFNLPPPIAHFWWKKEGVSPPPFEFPVGQLGEMGYFPADELEKISGKMQSVENRAEPQVIDWGELYGRLMPVIWHFMDSPPLNINPVRINPIGEHDPGNYYYVWQIRRNESY